MGDPNGTNPKRIPSWQLPQSSAASTTPESESHEHSDGLLKSSRALLVAKASKFLEDKEIREASRERKSDFLRTKGLCDEEINELLARENEVTETTRINDEMRAHESTDMESMENEEIENHNGNAQKPAEIDIMDDYIESEPGPPTKEEQPPIITYPEFLLRTQKPAPLITSDRLVTALYLVSGTATAMYGLSRYVLEPMVESLTSARHTFFESASSNIDTLNDKLENAVSKIPDGINDVEDKDGSDTGSLSSDAARFFSRTIATQTSPHLSRSTSSASLNEKSSTSITINHTDQLSKMSGLLSEFNYQNSDVSDQATENVRGLTEYLNDLPRLGRIGQVRSSKPGDQNSEVKIDGVTKVKAEVKGVKGALLSARNFPAGIANR